MKKDMMAWKDGVIKTSNVECLPLMTYPGLRLAGLEIPDVINDGEKHATLVKMMADRYPTVAAVTIMDLSIEAEAFGSQVRFSKDDVPGVIENIVIDMDSARALECPTVGDKRTGEYVKAARCAVETIAYRPVFAAHIAPFSLAVRLMGRSKTMVSISEQPALIYALLEKCTEFLVNYSKALRETGAHGLIMADPAAGLLSPQQCYDFSSVYIKRIVDEVQDDNFIVILHCNPKSIMQMEVMLSAGALGYHFGSEVDLKAMAPRIPGKCIFGGNLNPISAFLQGTPKHMEEKVFELLETMKPYPNFVLSSGWNIPPKTPLENINAFFSALDRFNSLEKRTMCLV